MNNLNEQIKIETRNVKFLYDNQLNQIISVDNSFQRKFVWSERNMVKLIETILMNFPIPEIYIWGQGTDPDSGNTTHSIVDGQQRLSTLTKFVNNEFKLTKSILDEDNQNELGNKFFQDLSSSLKTRIWKYNFSVRFIDEEVERASIVELFLRLNSTEFTLNPQELRNAKFNGLFLQLAEDLANNLFWEKHNIFNKQDIRRMKDIQIISSFLIFLRKGIEHESTQKVLNETYDLYNEIYPEYDKDKKTFKDTLEFLDLILSQDKGILSDFIKIKTHFYTLFVVCYTFLEYKHQYIEISQYLTEWFTAYRNNEDTKFEGLVKYRQYNQESTQSKHSRLQRFNLLKQYLSTNFPLKI